MEDDFSVEKPRISKLIGPNYRPWSVQVRKLLVGQSLWEVVAQGRQDPKDPKETPEVPVKQGTGCSSKEGTTGTTKPIDPDRTVVKDARASTLIMGLCGQGALQHILLLDTAKEQWDALKAQYSPLGLQQLGVKLQAFTAYQPRNGASS
jgi:hypothetical protein